MSFEATVTRSEGTGTGTFVVVPLDVRATFGRARPPVRVTINGHTYRSTIAVYGGVSHVGIAREHRDAAAITAGDRITVTLESDDEPRTVTLPDDLAAAMADDAEAARTFEVLPYTHKLEYVRWIDAAKRPETRARRLATTLDRLREGPARDV